MPLTLPFNTVLRFGVCCSRRSAPGTPCGLASLGISAAVDACCQSTCFDRVPWQVLQQGLRMCQVSDGLIALILEMHNQVRIRVQQGRHYADIDNRQGLRQGCTLAPTLYLVYKHVVFHQLERRLGSSWVETCLSAYADDLLTMQSFTSVEGLRQSLKANEVLLLTLLEAGMTPNYGKTVCLIDTRGTQAKQTLRRHTFRKSKDHYWTPGFDASVLFPLRTQQQYLGAVLSYKNFETLTLKRRLSVSSCNFVRLWRVLRNRNLQTKVRLGVYRSYVWPALTYGFCSFGITESGALTLYRTVLKQLRQVAKCSAYMTRLTHAQFLDMFELQCPLLSLYHVASNRLSLGVASWEAMPATFRRVQQWRQAIADRLGCLSQATPGRVVLQAVPSAEPDVQPCACPDCGVFFRHQEAMRIHRTKVHREVAPTRRELEVAGGVSKGTVYPTSHALDGMPTCKHCGREFSSWHRFADHVRYSVCPVLPAQTKLPGAFSSTRIECCK